MAKKSEWDEIAALETAIAFQSTNISAVNVGNGAQDIVDVLTREVALDNRYRIDDIKDIIAGGVNFRGKTATGTSANVPTDGLSGNAALSIDMAGNKTLVVTQGVAGDMVIVPSAKTGAEDREFIWDGEKWNEFGSASTLKAFAFANEGEVSITPQGNITVELSGAQNAPLVATFTGTQAELTSGISINSYTPEGTISCGDYTPEGGVSVADIVVGDKSITVKEVSSATFTGSEVSVAATFTGSELSVPASFTGSEVSVAATFTGTKANISISPTISTEQLNVTGILSALPVLSTHVEYDAPTFGGVSGVAGNASVTDGVLSFDFKSVLSSLSSSSQHLTATAASDYDLTTDPKDIRALSGGLNVTGHTNAAVTYIGDVSCNYTPAGTVTTTPFSPEGTITTTKVTPAGTVSTTKFTPSGTIAVGQKDVTKTISIGTLSTTATFTGTAKAPTATFTGTAKAPTAQNISIMYTPAGSVTGTATVSAHTHTATFGGTTGTFTVYPKNS